MTESSIEVVAEYHPHPSPHFVFDEATWVNFKTNLGAVEDTRISGQVGWATGCPVYIDECPALWNCKSTERQSA